MNTQRGVGIIAGLITPVHSLMLSFNFPVYQVRLDWFRPEAIMLKNVPIILFSTAQIFTTYSLQFPRYSKLMLIN